MLKGKMYEGNMPLSGCGWDTVGRFLDSDCVEWLVFGRAQDHSPDWLTYKVVANGRAINKANYWFARNNKTRQIGFSKDYLIMKNKRPPLFSYIEKMFS